MPSSLLRALALLSLLVLAPVAGAQRTLIIAVQVTDSASAPLEGVVVTVRRDFNTTIGSTTTDWMGRAALRISTEAQQLEVAARRVGLQPTFQYVRVGARDTIPVILVVARVDSRLDTVRVTAEATKKRQRQFIDADAIANASRPVHDGLDVVLKLRPDIIYGVAGSRVCGPAKHIWVNGQRIRNVQGNFMVEQRRQELTDAKFKHPPPILDVPVDVANVLATIKPEHIATIELRDCMDASMEHVAAASAIYVALKPGVHYENGIGSVVTSAALEDSLLKRVMRIPRAVLYDATPIQQPRLLGVYDPDTGRPIVDAEVIEVITGTKALTSETGAVTLGWLSPGERTLAIQKAGYQPDTLHITIGADTTPITHLLRRATRAP